MVQDEMQAISAALRPFHEHQKDYLVLKVIMTQTYRLHSVSVHMSSSLTRLFTR